MHCTFEAARRRAVPSRFNFVACVKFELALPIRCRLKSVFTAYNTLRHAVTLNFDPVTLTFDLELLWSLRVVCSNCVKFEQNRIIRCRVIDDLAICFRGGVVPNSTPQRRWTKLYQIWREQSSIISAPTPKLW